MGYGLNLFEMGRRHPRVALLAAGPARWASGAHPVTFRLFSKNAWCACNLFIIITPMQKMSQAPETAAEVAASAREEPLTRPTATGESDESGVGSEQTCVDLPDLKGMLPQELQELAIELGERAYRGRQLYSWIHERGVDELSAMTDLPASFRRQLASSSRVSRLGQTERREAAEGTAVKFVFHMPGARHVEAVLISDGDRRTACLSSQVGCPLDCQFCATGRMGFLGNLTAAQIVDQFLELCRYASARGERVTNVVMMGMGEPLLNYDNLVQALRIMRVETGPSIGGRRITVSTAGYVPGIRRLAADDLNVGLAISLNATTDELRSQLMPINRKYPIAELLAAAEEFFSRRGRRVTYEYVLMAGVTDTDEDARRL
ncbi:MAG TPA: 23S rRNA (adenine(2503)-C(2))-methyltransferase RlmN, partial [Candidatus Latescibacteria bacterium]|nr:23S rRNA (adenine(2503)-C(2))-methyltransferase RlmN [Candidatus Latescibacterota bacterium]